MHCYCLYKYAHKKREKLMCKIKVAVFKYTSMMFSFLGIKQRKANQAG